MGSEMGLRDRCTGIFSRRHPLRTDEPRLPRGGHFLPVHRLDSRHRIYDHSRHDCRSVDKDAFRTPRAQLSSRYGRRGTRHHRRDCFRLISGRHDGRRSRRIFHCFPDFRSRHRYPGGFPSAKKTAVRFRTGNASPASSFPCGNERGITGKRSFHPLRPHEMAGKLHSASLPFPLKRRVHHRKKRPPSPHGTRKGP